MIQPITNYYFLYYGLNNNKEFENLAENPLDFSEF